MKVRLEGVNALLKTVGEIQLVDEADFASSEEAVQAEQQIESTLISVLSEGFKFNKYVVNLKPDLDGYIAVPPSALVMNFSDPALSINNGVVFNRDDYTSIFTEPIDVEVTTREDFDYVPIVIQEYIIAEASATFQRNVINDADKNAELERVLNMKRRNLNIYKIRQAKGNGKDARFARNSNPVPQ